jgi:hypothetical protein
MVTLTHHDTFFAQSPSTRRGIPSHLLQRVGTTSNGGNVWRAPSCASLADTTRSSTHQPILKMFSSLEVGFSVLFEQLVEIARKLSGIMRLFQNILQPGSLEAEAGIFCLTFDITGTSLITPAGGADKIIKVPFFMQSVKLTMWSQGVCRAGFIIDIAFTFVCYVTVRTLVFHPISAAN